MDTSYENQYNKFIKELRKFNISLKDIRYLLLTHHHSDHTGFAYKILKNSEVILITHKESLPFLKNGKSGLVDICDKYGKTLKWVFNTYSKIHRVNNKYVPIKHKNIIVLNGDNDEILEEIGINGKIIYTPGHTDGSISILLDNGDAIVGYLIMNIMPVKKKFFPIVISDYKKLLSSWLKVMKSNVKRIYHSHGKMILVNDFEKFYNKNIF